MCHSGGITDSEGLFSALPGCNRKNQSRRNPRKTRDPKLWKGSRQQKSRDDCQRKTAEDE